MEALSGRHFGVPWRVGRRQAARGVGSSTVAAAAAATEDEDNESQARRKGNGRMMTDGWELRCRG